MKLTRQEITAVANKTRNAYSFDRYANWHACAVALARRGYDAREIEAILRSKHMRWAATRAEDYGKRYGRVTSVDLNAYLDNSPLTTATVADLVSGTFDNGSNTQ